MKQSRLQLRAALRDAGLDWIVPDWPASAEINALVTTRNGGAGTGARATMNLGRNGGDEPAVLAANRRRLNAFLPATPVWLDQVHGTAVATLDRMPERDAPAPIADGAVTRERGIVCAVLTADCLPVLFAERQGNAVGIAHAGWRGLAAGIIESTLAAMRELGAQPRNLVAWLGPGIGPEAFEVGDEVRAAFCDCDPAAASCFAPHWPGKWTADLAGLARRRLAAAGVSHVSGGDYCTYRDGARFFSYRRERATGRMAALVWRAPLAPP
jgi:YfiH family protein